VGSVESDRTAPGCVPYRGTDGLGIPFIRFGKHKRFDPSDIRALNENKVEPLIFRYESLVVAGAPRVSPPSAVRSYPDGLRSPLEPKSHRGHTRSSDWPPLDEDRTPATCPVAVYSVWPCLPAT
jgi:hypothetical protein